MSSKSNDFESKMLRHALAVTQHTYTSSVWIALFSTAPGEGTAGTELSGNGYARLEIAGSTGRSFTEGSGSASNTEEWQFPAASGSSWTINGFAVMDAVSTGNIRYYKALGSPVTINVGDVARFATGALVITED